MKAVHLLLLATLTACGAQDVLTAEETAALNAGNDETVATEKLLLVTDSLYPLDGREEAVEARAREIGCATVSRDGANLTVVFAEGCSVNGVPVSGGLEVGVVKSGDTVSVAFELDALEVDGAVYSGTLTVAGSSGEVAVTGTLVQDGQTVSFDLAVAGDAGAWVVNGTVTISEANTTLALSDVHYQRGDCYPNQGTVGIQRGNVSATATFDANTAMSGEVTVTVGRASELMTLPAYAECPAA